MLQYIMNDIYTEKKLSYESVTTNVFCTFASILFLAVIVMYKCDLVPKLQDVVSNKIETYF